MNEYVNCIRCKQKLDYITEAILGYVNEYWCTICWKNLNDLQEDLIEKFINSYQPERSKREDSLSKLNIEEEGSIWINSQDNKAWKMMNNHWHFLGTITKDISLLDLITTEMRCSEHCGDTMREVQEASSPVSD